MFQIAQIVTNVEHFHGACSELEKSLTNLRWATSYLAELRCKLFRSAQRGGIIRLTSASAFEATLSHALARISSVNNSKLDDFFGLSEYDWTPPSREDSPSMYLYELVNWLTTVVDSLVIKESYKDEAYKGAVAYIADCFMVCDLSGFWCGCLTRIQDFLTGRNITMMNEHAISNILIDVDFLEEELKRIGRGHLASAFVELRSVCRDDAFSYPTDSLDHLHSFV